MRQALALMMGVVESGEPVDRPDLLVGIEDIMALMGYEEAACAGSATPDHRRARRQVRAQAGLVLMMTARDPQQVEASALEVADLHLSYGGTPRAQGHRPRGRSRRVRRAARASGCGKTSLLARHRGLRASAAGVGAAQRPRCGEAAAAAAQHRARVPELRDSFRT
jgi:hypothetical protein